MYNAKQRGSIRNNLLNIGNSTEDSTFYIVDSTKLWADNLAISIHS